MLSDGEILVELTTTQESESDYDILIQGSDRQHPAIVIRRKHRGVGATIRTISKFGTYRDLYDDYAEVIRAYQERRDNRRKATTTRGDSEGGSEMAREAWVNQTVRSVVEGSEDGKGD